jgi:GNAT superfamily N-acetyltransferase
MTPVPAIREIPPGESLGPFIDVAWRINARDPFWVPPLRMAVRTALDRRKHPFHQHSEVAYFLAERPGKPVGRIAAILNRRHNEFHSDRIGFFGLFECADDPGLAAALLGAAEGWLRSRGCDTIRGPVNFSTNDEISSPGVLVEGFERRPFVMMSHNPPYYGALLEAAGLERVRDIIAFFFDDPAAAPQRGVRSIERILEREGATVRALDLKNFARDVEALKEVYNSAWSRNWGFVPMTDAEFEHLAKEFRPVVDPDLCLIAERAGEPIGFSLALPDLNEVFARIPDGRLFPFGFLKFLWYRRTVRRMRVMTLGFKPRYRHSGLGVAFYLRTWLAGASRGYTMGEASWILEENHDMVRPLERMGGKPYKRYRLFERRL